MRIGNFDFDVKNETYVMGILNVTPDSFSDGGLFNHLDAALRHTEEMIKEGAALIDVGGESTKPGYTAVSEQEEIFRVVPIIEKIKKEFNISVSVDTYKSAVARAAIEAGADLVNDIWGLKADPAMGKVIAEAGVACCLMHNRNNTEYGNLMEDVLEDLRGSVALAKAAGIGDDRIIVDPGVGVGFGKTYEQNLSVISRVGELKVLGYPVLLGASRKSVIGRALGVQGNRPAAVRQLTDFPGEQADFQREQSVTVEQKAYLSADLPEGQAASGQGGLPPVEERLEGTLVTTVCAVQQGCSFVRVHDVKENVRAIRMTRALAIEAD